MTSTPTRRWSAGALLVWAACCALIASQQAAVGVPAAGLDRAVVLIDDGTSRRAYCVRFSGEISGLDALDATGEPTVKAGFGGMGAAVCSIGGTGCTADRCLTCQAPSYWRYYRAVAGTSSFRPSGAGASTTRVRDGDVDAWAWGTSAPAGAVPSVDAVCGPRPTTTTAAPPPRPTAPPATPPPVVDPGTPPAPGPADPGLGGIGDLPPPTVAPPGDAPVGPTTTAPATTTSEAPPTTSEATTTTTAADEDAGADTVTDLTVLEPGSRQSAAGPGPDADPSGGGGSWWGLAGVAVVLAGVGGWAWRLRRREAA